MGQQMNHAKENYEHRMDIFSSLVKYTISGFILYKKLWRCHAMETGGETWIWLFLCYFSKILIHTWSNISIVFCILFFNQSKRRLSPTLNIVGGVPTQQIVLASKASWIWLEVVWSTLKSSDLNVQKHMVVKNKHMQPCT